VVLEPKTHIVEAAHGFAFKVQKGHRFRVVDLYGEQVVDFAAWVQGTDLKEKLSCSYTRFHLAGVTPAVGEYLYSNRDEPILKLVEDTVKVHDMTFVRNHPSPYPFTAIPSDGATDELLPRDVRKDGSQKSQELCFQHRPSHAALRDGLIP
jgi:uncharacterized protein YcgI (DUF1989 family)